MSNWLAEMKAAKIRAAAGQPTKRFTWEESVGKPSADTMAPAADLGTAATAKATEAPAPAADLPRTNSGHIDNSALKEGLTQILKASRKRRS